MTASRIDAILAAAAQRLNALGDGRREARQLWEAAGPRRFLDHADDHVSREDRFEDFVKLRLARVPMSHIRGYRDFWKHRFVVTSDVLDPRPDTETLVDAALKVPFETVWDLGTGSGCILLSVLADRPSATGVGIDVSGKALAVAKINADALSLTDRVVWHQGDLFAQMTGPVDLIVSNPPYIAADEMPGLAPELSHEPRVALTDEADGLSFYRRIAAQAAAYLAPQGRVLVEIGSTQGPTVASLFRDAGFTQVAILPDFDGRDRVVQAKRG